MLSNRFMALVMTTTQPRVTAMLTHSQWNVPMYTPLSTRMEAAAELAEQLGEGAEATAVVPHAQE